MGARRNSRSGHSKGRSHKAPAQQNQPSNSVAAAPQSEPEARQPEAQASHNQTENRYERRIANWTVVVGAFTVVLAIATAGSGYVLWLTDHTLKDTLAANNAYNRAFIFFKELANGQTVEADQTSTNWTFISNVENNGNTQTKNAKVSIACDIAVVQDIFSGKIKPDGPRVFGPKQTMGSGACTWPSKELDQGRKQNKVFIVGGVVEYGDIFGGKHVTRYCRQIHILADPNPKGGKLEHVTALCPGLPDCADEECH